MTELMKGLMANPLAPMMIVFLAFLTIHGVGLLVDLWTCQPKLEHKRMNRRGPKNGKS